MNVSGYPRPCLGQVNMAHITLGHGREAPATTLDPMGLRGRWRVRSAHFRNRARERGRRCNRCGYRGRRHSRDRGWRTEVAGAFVAPFAS